MALSDIVNITLDKTNPGVTLAGFGTALLQSATAAWLERARTYTDIAGVASDFAVTTTEYLAANAYFSQEPRPPKLMIGRFANKPTQVWDITVAAVADSTAYKVTISNQGVLQTATFTSGAGTTNDLIAAGIRAAINALAAPALNFTATLTGAGGSQRVLVTANAPGNWAAVEVLDYNLLSVAETEVDPGVVADLTAIDAETKAWYGLLLTFKSNLIVLAAAGWVESNARLFIVSTADTQAAVHAEAGATDVLHNLKAAARARTGGSFHQRGYEFLDVCQVGRWFAIDPGRDNWRMKTLSGPTPGWGPTGVALTGTHITNIEAKRGNYYYVLGASGGGVNLVGGEGKVADNEYIDVIRGLDWYAQNLQVDLVNYEIDEEKIPYDDDGISAIAGIIRARNKLGIAQGVIAPTPLPTVTVPRVADVSSGDKASRTLNGVSTKWTLAGAINKMNVTVHVLQ